MLRLPPQSKQQIMQRPDAPLPKRGGGRTDPEDDLEEDFIQSAVRAADETPNTRTVKVSIHATSKQHKNHRKSRQKKQQYENNKK